MKWGEGMYEHAAVVLVGIVVTGALCQWLAWQFKQPAILLLLFAGLLLGPVTGLIDPDQLLGDLLFPLVSLSVAVILFEGALRLQYYEVKGGLGRVVRNLVTVGAAINWVVMAVGARLLMDFTWELAFLFGAVVTVTGPTVIVPLLRSMRPNATIARVLRWEGILIDPFGALLALLVFEYIVSGQRAAPLTEFALSIAAGLGIGAIGAVVVAYLLRRHLLPGFLVNVVVLALVLAVFAVANGVREETGLLAVTVMGLMLANMRDVPAEEVLDFKESLSVMLISVLFIVLAARLDFAPLAPMTYAGLGVLAVVVLLARPLSVAVSTLGSPLDWRERAVVGWVAPRGIVAAAVSAAFAIRLEVSDYPQATLLAPLTFLIIIGTVVLQSLTARPVARWLGVSEPEPRGVLIVGAHRVAREIGLALKDNGFRSVLADTSWEDLRAARMEGLNTYFGSAISEHADRHLDLVGVGRLLAMTPRPAFNALACLRFRNEFGANNVFALRTPEEGEAGDKRLPARHFSCTRLFGDDVTLSRLSGILTEGGEIHTTLLTENFGFGDYLHSLGGEAMPLFTLDPDGGLHLFTSDTSPEPAAGWSVIGVITGHQLELVRERRESSRGGGNRGINGSDGTAGLQ